MRSLDGITCFVVLVNGVMKGRRRGECKDVDAHEGLLNVTKFLCASWVVGWRGCECKFCGGWASASCFGRQKRLCGSSLISVSSACMT
jgi:hypothetical protein